jgi:Arc/MetJ-type ribon-helix-helix transcriptional regulator
MKLSVSLPDEDIEFLDAYAREQGITSRSAVIRQALRLLRDSELSSDYAQAWDEWADNDDSRAWESVIADGLPPGS